VGTCDWRVTSACRALWSSLHRRHRPARRTTGTGRSHRSKGNHDLTELTRGLQHVPATSKAFNATSRGSLCFFCLNQMQLGPGLPIDQLLLASNNDEERYGLSPVRAYKHARTHPVHGTRNRFGSTSQDGWRNAGDRFGSGAAADSTVWLARKSSFPPLVHRYADRSSRLSECLLVYQCQQACC
jgi:hypothetical protein